MSDYIDYSERPDGVSRSQWAALEPKLREAEIERQENVKRQQNDEFESHMLYSPLSTRELTWLRDRIFALEAQK
jgi:hypothetical protein